MDPLPQGILLIGGDAAGPNLVAGGVALRSTAQLAGGRRPRRRGKLLISGGSGGELLDSRQWPRRPAGR